MYKSRDQLVTADLSQVTKVRVTALVGNTYHARVHMSTSGKDACSNEVDIDARPSDAINLAVRFNAPVYVNKQVCHHLSTVRSALQSMNVMPQLMPAMCSS